MTRRALLPLVLVWPLAAAAQPHSLNLQATPHASPLIPLPPTPPATMPGGSRYDAAPLPNRDLDAPLGPRTGTAPELAPGLFTRSHQYRGDGFSAGSSAQSEQERRARPGAGFKLRMPLQSQ